ncbi:hypothetical protein R1TS_20690 [Enterobacter cloacae]|nr:hypothetical protein R1TS_20690 [Enterobacter cloacae]
MNHTDFLRYQAESVKRANLPPVAKHSQTKTNQPQKEAACTVSNWNTYVSSSLWRPQI